MNEPVDFDITWSALSLPGRLAVVTLVGEAAAIAHGLSGDVDAITHGWHAVADPAIGQALLSADTFNALTRGPDAATPPGFVEALVGLLAEPSDDGAARAFFARCDPADVLAATNVVHDAVTHGTDLTPPAVLQHEFRRLRG